MSLFAAALLCLAAPVFGAPQSYITDSRHGTVHLPNSRYGYKKTTTPYQTYRTEARPQPLTYYNYHPAAPVRVAAPVKAVHAPLTRTQHKQAYPQPFTVFNHQPVTRVAAPVKPVHTPLRAVPGPVRPIPTPVRASPAPVTRTGPTQIDTAWGVFPLAASNAGTFEERNRYLPVMRALLKVMETSTPAPEDVNTLLVLTRDLTKQIPEGSSFLPTFNGFNVADMGLPEDGDVIIDYEGVPHIVTQFGAFPLSDVSLMTDEERERFLPATRTFVSVLEKPNLDQREIDQLIKESEALSVLIPESMREVISSSLSNLISARSG